MISLSYSGTMKLIDCISKDHDIEVQFWSDNLLSSLKVVKSFSVFAHCTYFIEAAAVWTKQGALSCYYDGRV